jgi:hypothetical protein
VTDVQLPRDKLNLPACVQVTAFLLQAAVSDMCHQHAFSMSALSECQWLAEHSDHLVTSVALAWTRYLAVIIKVLHFVCLFTVLSVTFSTSWPVADNRLIGRRLGGGGVKYPYMPLVRVSVLLSGLISDPLLHSASVVYWSDFLVADPEVPSSIPRRCQIF